MKNMRVITILIFLWLFLYPIPYTLYPSYAATSTPSADIQAKLKALMDGSASMAATQLKNEVSKKLKNKAYVGIVKVKSDSLITLALESGTKMVTINEFTEYSGKKLSFKTIIEGDYLIALGDIDDNEVLTAKKIIRTTAPKEINRQFIFGTILSLGDNLITLQDKNNQNIIVTISRDTDFKGVKNQTLSFADLKAGYQIIVAGTSSKTGTLEAEFIYLPGYLTPPKIATPSAKTKN